ncbi:MAG TPA: hypothetical protein VN962_26845, partial [Polyangia bacterium]|nr:hypothetical protein [Polyangia bacterium]
TTGEPRRIVAAAGAALTIDLGAHSVIDVTASGAACAITPVVHASATRAYAATVFLRQGAGGGCVWTFLNTTFAAPPTFSLAPNAVDAVTLFSTDGGATFMGFAPVAAPQSSHGIDADEWRPDGFLAENTERDLAGNNEFDFTSQPGQPFLFKGPRLKKGVAINKISVFNGSTPAAGMTHSFMAIVDRATRKPLAVSADDTTAAWPAFAWRHFTLPVPFVPLGDGPCLAAMVSGPATTQPRIRGNSVAGLLGAMSPREVAKSADTGLTDPSTLPATLGVFSDPSAFVIPYCAFW